ncbi:MAG: DUF2213 domain-containing protein [Bacilli bacterium]|nr:DUF2213 domain-containing protein [Bacilli bacterium]
MGKVVDRNDFWFIEKNPITKVGVFPYLGKQISEDCEPDKIYYVLRPKEELFKKETLDSLKLLPLVDEHTMLGKDFTPAEEKGVEGILGEQVVHDTDTIYTDIKIFSEDMKEKIRDGKKELSLGYFCTYDKQEGTYNGQRYDYVQKNIIGNHLALVDKGRMGSDVRVYDKAIENRVYCCDSLKDIDIEKMEYKKNNEEKKEMADEKKQVTIDEDKRKLIDEIGGMLKDKVSEEVWRTIVGKIEKVAYNESEAGKGTDEDEKEDGKVEEKEDKKPAKDKCSKDEDKDEKVEDEDEKKDDEVEDEEEEKKEDKKGMDEADVIKIFARKEKLGKQVEEVLGTFDHSEMTELEIAKYACDKLELGAEEGQEISTLKGYLKGVEKKKVIVSMKTEDSDVNVAEDKSFDNYIKNAKK